MLSKICYLLMLCHHGRLVKYCYSISDVWSKSLRHKGIFFQLILFPIFNIIITMKGEKEQSELSNNYTFHQSSFDHLSFWLYLMTWWLRLWPNRITQRTVCHATTKEYTKALICCQSKTLHLQKMKMPNIYAWYFTQA